MGSDAFSAGTLRTLGFGLALVFGLTHAAPPHARADSSAPRSAPSLSPSSPPVLADAQLEQARTIVSVAERLFSAGHHAAALAEYSRAYEVLEGHPRQYWVLHNLAVCNERLFRYDLALSYYEQYLARAPAAEGDRHEVAAVMRTLRSLVTTLVVDAPVAGEVWVDDRRMGAAPGRWLIPAGRHIVEFRAALHQSERREVQLTAGRSELIRFDPPRLSTYRGPGPGYFWLAIGATGAAAITGAALGTLALSARDEGRERAALFLDTRDDAQRTRTLALGADAGFGAALIFGVTATVLYFVTDWSPQQSPSGQHPRAAAVLHGTGPGESFRLEF